MTITYDETIREQIIQNLDGWEVEVSQVSETETSESETTTESEITSEVVEEPSLDQESSSTTTTTTTTTTSDVDVVPAFITDINEYTNKPNKTIKDSEVENFFYQSLNKALLYCNRFNIDDLSELESTLFIKGVCLLAASDLWNKYNIRVNNEDMEDTYIQSFGGLLYKQAMNILNSFINQRVTNLTSLRKTLTDNNNDSTIWRV